MSPREGSSRKGLCRSLAALARPHVRHLAGGLALLAATSAIETLIIPVLFTALLVVVVGPEVLGGRYTIPIVGVDVARLSAAALGSTSRAGLLLAIAVAGVLAMATKALCHAGRLVFAHEFSFAVAYDLRSRLFTHLLGQSADFYEHERTGALLSRLTGDIYVLREGLGPPLFEIAQAPLTIAFALGLMLSISWPLTLATLAIAPPVVLALSWAGRLMRRLTISRQDRLARLNGYIAERLGAVQIIQAFGRESHELDEMRRLDSAYFRDARRLVWLYESMGPGNELLVGLGMLAGLAFGGWSVLGGSLPREHFILFFAIAPAAGSQLGRLARIGQIRQQIAGAATRLLDLLETVPSIADAPGARPLPAVGGHVRLDHVSFRYRTGGPVLQDVTLEVAPGEMLAIVGPSGAGKSTLVRLLPRFFDPTDGRVLVDGIDLRTVTLASLRGQIGLVSQDAILLNHTVAENIAYGRPGATLEELHAAAAAAHATDFIEALPLGWETIVGERGATLSGGQRQRIAIARALLRNPRILILDEATSALDSSSERLVQSALGRLVAGRTTLVIAHRLSTVRHANRIVVLHGGRIVELGTHVELMERSGLYRRLHDAQFVLSEAVAR